MGAEAVPPALPYRFIPAVYVPARTTTVSPAPAVLAAFCSVLNAAASAVPGLASAPEAPFT